jgi:hypothetical protein
MGGVMIKLISRLWGKAKIEVGGKTIKASDHDAEIFLIVLYAVFKIGALFVTPEQHYWYATLHGHSDDVLGVFLAVACYRYFREDTG